MKPNFPFNPARWPFFYGWWILFTGTLIMLAATPSMPMGFGVFIEALVKAFDLTRVQISGIYTVATIAAGLLLPWAGRLVDRYGARLVLTLSSLLFGAAFLYLSNYAALLNPLFKGDNPGMEAGVTMGLLLPGFFGLRFFGHGVFAIAGRTMIAKWFNRKRGLSSALHWVALTIVFSFIPLSLNKLLENLTWRGAWTALGLFVALGISFTAWLFLRDNPEECGLEMDGLPAGKEIPGLVENENHHTYHEFTLREALRTLAFWVFLLAFANSMIFFTSVTFHIIAFGMEMGMTKSEALGMFIPMSVLTVSMTFFSGWLSNRISLKYLLLAFLLFQLGSSGGFLLSKTFVGPLLFILSFGCSGGVFGTLFNVTWPRYFGREHLGSINGVTMAMGVIAGAFGPLMFSISHDYLAGFHAAVMACMGLPALLLMLAFKVENPQLRYKTER